MLFSFLRSRRRRAIAERPFPTAWHEALRRSVRAWQWLDADDAEACRRWIAVFLDEKRFEGCGGFELSDEVRVCIAGQAAIASFRLGGEWFDSLKSVLVYPDDYLVPRSTPLGGGGELEWREARVGETWSGGSMALSWRGVLDGGRLRDGPRSVVIHEFAHLLDALDGDIDGLPPLPPGDRAAWLEGMAAARERFEAALDEGRVTAFDDYAAESDVEFFAVASECFFQDPHRLARHDPRLYRLLGAVWRQDPRHRMPARASRDR
jgi:Mlc titration factor MtfA (ptsG expression regulator)